MGLESVDVMLIDIEMMQFIFTTVFLYLPAWGMSPQIHCLLYHCTSTTVKGICRNASTQWYKGGICQELLPDFACRECQELPPDSNRRDLALTPIQTPLPFMSLV
jgi:hypothetical protein